MPEMKNVVKPRVLFVGSVTGNDNTVGGGGVYPIANLGDLEGFKYGAKKVILSLYCVSGFPNTFRTVICSPSKWLTATPSMAQKLIKIGKIYHPIYFYIKILY